MRRFADLFERLDRTTSTNARLDAMAAYFRETPPEDAAWGVYFLIGEKLKRLVKSADLRRWAMREAGIEEWLFRECRASVGDMAETIALLLPERAHDPEPSPEPVLLLETLGEDADAPSERDLSLSRWVERLSVLRHLEPREQERRVVSWWRELSAREVFILNKLMTGALRVGVSRTLVVRALARAFNIEKERVAHRLMGGFEPTPDAFCRLIAPEGSAEDRNVSRPYPFFLASPIAATSDQEADVESLGDAREYLAEWKWDGIRAQLIKRAGEAGGSLTLWSRGDEDLTLRFPEVTAAAARTPGAFVLDGELVAYDHDAQRPHPFGVLQTRIGRTNVHERALREAPGVFIAYDVLELDAADLRSRALVERRRLLEDLLHAHAGDRRAITVSECVVATSWEALRERRASSRSRGVEGLMLKRLDSPYRVGRVRGDWWKWKVEPLTIDAVLTYAQPGSGRRANLLTDYTFSVWRNEPGGELVTITKAYSGLNAKEIETLDKWIRQHTLERFGPVRRVEPTHVFEIGFEAIGVSDRHKAGLALRFPRMLRWRTDKNPHDADTLASVLELLPSRGADAPPAQTVQEADALHPLPEKTEDSRTL
ncbi:MAG: ATP-dependent DNA ligase [Phycisphaerales bacterium]|nr:MAG: ATP-dependent DNA ligase [Phycisphaerales bacterium]